MAVVTGPFWLVNLLFFIVAIGLGVAFILTSSSSSFYKWKMDTCDVSGQLASGEIFDYDVDLTVDIGWREFTVTYVDDEADLLCFEDIGEGGVYSLNDFQDNSAAAAGLGMVAVWGATVVVTMYTILAMIIASGGKRSGGVSLVTLMKLTVILALGIITATTVFWWMLEGKFGNRREALVPRLKEMVMDAAKICSTGTDTVAPCVSEDYDIITPGWSLSLGITAMFFYSFAAIMLRMTAARVQSMNTRTDDPDDEVAKVPTGDFVVDKQMIQSEEKVKAKDRRSARTGVRAAPSSTIEGGVADTPDPMTYALEEGGEGDQDSALDDEDEVMYKNHQVHHNVINHSQANRTQEVVDSRRQQQYQRGYSHATSGTSYRSGMGGQSFEERSEGDFSDASSARYYGQNQGRSFMSNSSGRGESFEESH